MKIILGKIVGYFFKGLIFLAPLAILAWVFYSLYQLTEYLDFFPQARWLGGLLVIGGGVIAVILLGFLVSSFLLKPLFQLIERIMLHIPLIKVIYGTIKDMVEAVVGEKKRFNRPVLVTLVAETNLQRIGFITEDDLSEFGLKDKVAVYIPMSYSFSGNLYIVPWHAVEPMKGVNASEAMKFVVSGGVTGADED